MGGDTMRILSKRAVVKRRQGAFGAWVLPSGQPLTAALEMSGRKRKVALNQEVHTLSALDRAFVQHIVQPQVAYKLKLIEAKLTRRRQKVRAGWR